MLIFDNSRAIRAVAAVCILLAVPALAIADDQAATVAPAIAPVVNGDDILSLAVSLLVVIGSIVAVGWLYSRLQGKKSIGGELINIVESRALGPKERIVLVDVADKQLLVGMTATQVQTLHVFDEPISWTATDAETGGFSERLRAAIHELKK